MVFILEVALDGINRSETPKSFELARLEDLRRRDEDSVVLLLLLITLLLLETLLLLKLVLLLLLPKGDRGGGVAGKKNRPGGSLRMVSIGRMGVGRKTMGVSVSRSILEVLGLVVDEEVGDLAVGVWKYKEEVANLLAYCRSNRDLIGEGFGARKEAEEDFVVDDVVDTKEFGVENPCGKSPW